MCSRTIWSEAELYSTMQLLALISRFLVPLFLRICTVSMESILQDYHSSTFTSLLWVFILCNNRIYM